MNVEEGSINKCNALIHEAELELQSQNEFIEINSRETREILAPTEPELRKSLELVREVTPNLVKQMKDMVNVPDI